VILYCLFAGESMRRTNKTARAAIDDIHETEDRDRLEGLPPMSGKRTYNKKARTSDESYMALPPARPMRSAHLVPPGRLVPPPRPEETVSLVRD
jgi:hypothetical protein